MIRIDRPDAGPTILQVQGATQRATLCERQENGEALLFERRIYGDASVKEALFEAQYGKCCYCEYKPRPGHWGDVEHFRPKQAVQQSAGGPLLRPGYYWLAYEWDNLLFSCPICNREHKRNLFPLSQPGRRARTHRDDLAEEEPLLINPAEEDPASYIGFRREIAFAIDENQKGRTTIDVLKLNRPDLTESRLTVYKRMQTLAALKVGGELLREFAQSDRQYAGMACAAIAAGFTI